LATITPGPTPAGGSGRVLASLSERGDGQVLDTGVFIVDLGSGQSKPILGEGYRLQDTSPDGTRLLVSRGNELWIARMDGALQVQLSSQLSRAGYPSAMWVEGGLQIAMIEETAGGREIIFNTLEGYLRIEPDSSDATRDAIALYPAGIGRLAWEYGECEDATCTLKGSRVTAPESSPVIDLPGKLHPLVSPSGTMLAYTYYDEEKKSRLGVTNLDGSFDREITLAGNHLMAYAWDPEGTRLSALVLERSDYSGRWFGINHYIISTTNWSIRQLKQVTGVNAQTHWSPDGTQLLVSGTLETEEGYKVGLFRVVPGRNSIEEILAPDGFEGEDFILLNRLVWIRN